MYRPVRTGNACVGSFGPWSSRQRWLGSDVTRLLSLVSFSLVLPPDLDTAVSFISKFLHTKGLTSEQQLETFSQSLQELLAERYKPHWFP